MDTNRLKELVCEIYVLGGEITKVIELAGEMRPIDEMQAGEVLDDDVPEPVPERYNVKCSTCGRPTTVPFKPNPKWPVHCKECYFARQGK